MEDQALWERIKREVVLDNMMHYMEEEDGAVTSLRDCVRLEALLTATAVAAVERQSKEPPGAGLTVEKMLHVVEDAVVREVWRWSRRRDRLLDNYIDPALQRFVDAHPQERNLTDDQLSEMKRAHLELLDDRTNHLLERSPESLTQLADALASFSFHVLGWRTA